MSRRYRIVRDIEALGGGFIREETISKTPFASIIKGTLYMKDGTSSKVAVRYRGSYGEIIGPIADKESVNSYKKILEELNRAETDLSTGYRRQLITRDKLDHTECISAALLTGIFLYQPIGSIFSHTESITTAVGFILWIIELLLIRKVFLELRKRQ